MGRIERNAGRKGVKLKSTDRINASAPDTERWYSGYLAVDIDPDQTSQLRSLIKDLPSFDVGANYLEVEYKGRDTSRMIVRTLIRVAQLVRRAKGEVRCQIEGDGDDLRFEFYRIEDGRLIRQLGKVNRGEETEVEENA
jgi:hypothetical protein